MNYLQRRRLMKRILKPVVSKYCVVFEDDIDAPARIGYPSIHWMAAALHGWIIPPLGVHGAAKQIAPPIGPLTEEEAIEHWLQLEIPEHVWNDKTTNRQKFVICRREQIPAKLFRSAWRLAILDDHMEIPA